MAPEGTYNRNWPRVLCLTISLNFYHCYHFVCISSILYFSCWVLATNLKLVSSTTVQGKKKDGNSTASWLFGCLPVHMLPLPVDLTLACTSNTDQKIELRHEMYQAV